jgi:hypothetical protein
MSERHQHLTAQVRQDIAARVGGPLWKPTAAWPEDPDGNAAPKIGRL